MTPSNANLPAAPTKVGSTIVLKSLSILLGLFFIFIGAMKLTPHLSKELHRDLVGATAGVGVVSLTLISSTNGNTANYCSNIVS